jgi:branched-chain amino acid transport system permease protein
VVALRQAGLAALVMLLLALPLIGLRLNYVDRHNGLVVRPGWVAIAVAVVFLGRFANLAPRPRIPPRVAAFVFRLASQTKFARPPGWLFMAAGVAVAICFPLTPMGSRYDVDLATTFLIYVMLGWGLNIVVGLAGLLDLGYVAFYAAGAYTAALLGAYFGIGFWLALPLSGLVSGTLGMLLGLPVLRLKGDYLAIVTLGFGEIIRIVLINWSSLTGGPNGISGVPRPSFLGAPFVPGEPSGVTTFAQLTGLPYSPLQRIDWLYYIILAMALLTLAFTERLRRLPIGRAWEALREDEIACVALGLNPTLIKLSAFSMGAMLGGFAGCFFAARQGFVSPESFTFSESAVILAIVVLGGMGSQFGVVVAAAVLVGLPELSRGFAELRMLLFGMAMVLIMIWRPGGLIAGRTPTVRIDIAGWRTRRAGLAR